MNTSRFFSTLSVLLLVTVMSACAMQPIAIKPDVFIETLAVCLDFNTQIGIDEKLLYLNATDELVAAHNQASNLPQLVMCNETDEHALNITVLKTNLVEPSKQAFYVLLSIAGIAYPLSGGSIGFAWLGANSTSVEISVSKALAAATKPVYAQFYSSPYFLSADEVRLKHMQRFKTFVNELLQQIDDKATQTGSYFSPNSSNLV